MQRLQVASEDLKAGLLHKVGNLQYSMNNSVKDHFALCMMNVFSLTNKWFKLGENEKKKKQQKLKRSYNEKQDLF